MDRQAGRIYEFGPFRLIPEERLLLRDGRPVPLTGKPFDLLVALVENSGRLIKKRDLMDLVWPDAAVEEGNLTVTVSALRRALGEGPDDHQFIETVPRRGYRFVAEVRLLRDEGAGPRDGGPGEEEGDAARAADGGPQSSPQQTSLPKTSPPPPAASGAATTAGALTASRARAPVRRWLLAAGGLLVLCVLLLASNVGGLRERLWGGGDAVRVRSLAVLPLENLSGDPSQDYFADGMTEALIADLAKAGELRVISRQSVMRYKGARRPAREIGRELNVDAVLTGSVVRSGGRVRINTQLAHAATERSLWAGSYERDLRDVLALQREVARDIAGEIGVRTTPQERVRFGGVRPVNPEAYDHYLRGRFYLHRQSRENNEAAVSALERAVAADPDFAAAHAELAQACVWRFFLFTPEERQWEERAYVAVEKALSLDPDLAEAHLARGRLLWTPANRFPHDKAIQEYRRALDLNPSLDEARNQLALVYSHVGLLDEALAELERAVAANPSNTLARFRVGEVLLFQGKNEEALAALRNVPAEANPALVGHQIVLALFNLGRKEEASAAVEQFLKEYPDDNRGLFTSLQAIMAASAGQGQAAEAKIKSAVEKGRGFGHFHHTAYHIACAYALMNKREQAISWLESAADDGFPCYPLFEKDANLNNLRQEARFVALLERLRRQREHYRAAP